MMRLRNTDTVFCPKVPLSPPLQLCIRVSRYWNCWKSVAEPHHHHLYAAPAPPQGKNFDAAPVAPTPTLLYRNAKFLKQTKV
jgi:hypothetical protein